MSSPSGSSNAATRANNKTPPPQGSLPSSAPRTAPASTAPGHDIFSSAPSSGVQSPRSDNNGKSQKSSRARNSSRRASSLKFNPTRPGSVSKSPSVISVTSGLSVPALTASVAAFPSRASAAPPSLAAPTSAPSHSVARPSPSTQPDIGLGLPPSPSSTSTGAEEGFPAADATGPKHAGPTASPPDRMRTASLPDSSESVVRRRLASLMANHRRAEAKSDKPTAVPNTITHTPESESERKTDVGAPTAPVLDDPPAPQPTYRFAVRQVPPRTRRYSAPAAPLPESPNEARGFHVALELQAAWSLDLIVETRAWRAAERIAALTYAAGSKSFSVAHQSVLAAHTAADTLVHPSRWPQAASYALRAPPRLAAAALQAVGVYGSTTSQASSGQASSTSGSGVSRASGTTVSELDRSGFSTATSIPSSGSVVLAHREATLSGWPDLPSKYLPKHFARPQTLTQTTSVHSNGSA